MVCILPCVCLLFITFAIFFFQFVYTCTALKKNSIELLEDQTPSYFDVLTQVYDLCLNAKLMLCVVNNCILVHAVICTFAPNPVLRIIKNCLLKFPTVYLLFEAITELSSVPGF